MEKKLLEFLEQNSADGGFLQSEYWRKFQESYGRKAFELEEKDDDGDTIIFANMITHTLTVVGDYFYIPRGPVFWNYELGIRNYEERIKNFVDRLINLAEEKNIGWIRIEPVSDEELKLIKINLPSRIKIKKSPVDMQPREILTLDIAKSEEDILAGMKQKTRYNIKLSQKHGVSVKAISNFQFPISKKYVDDFLRLVEITSKRDKIKAHPENYYRKMFETIPPEILKLYVAEYGRKVISANLVLFFGKTATYMHGASDNVCREVMAPYLLQWQAIQDAKKKGCTKYDLGGVKSEGISNLKSQISNSWSGITKFKTGFDPETEPARFPGCLDIVLN